MLTNWGALLRRWRRRWSRAEWAINRFQLPRSDAPSHSPGLLLVQIDGLAKAQLEHALKSGRMPFLQQLIKQGGYDLSTFYSGLPSSTPAVQAELHYGVKCAVPAFSFLDSETDKIGMMMQTDSAKRVEARLQKSGEGLLRDGSSWSNIYSGGATAANSHFCGTSIGFGDLWRTGKLAQIPLFAVLHFVSFLRLVMLLPVEFILGLYDAIRGITNGEPFWRELKFILLRVFVCIGLRELITIGTKIDLARGLPCIHVNLLGYDEQSHGRGPGSRYAHWTLRGIDRAVKHLHQAARRSEGRDYEIWLFSDHGQVRTKAFDKLCPGGLEELVRQHWPDFNAADYPPRARATRNRRQAPSVLRRTQKSAVHSELDAFEQKEFAVAAMGPVGHIYFRRPLGEEATDELIRNLLEGGVPGILRRKGERIVWHTRDGVHDLPSDLSLIRGPEKLRPIIAEDLERLARHRDAGDIIALGWHPEQSPISFAFENGAHAGPSPRETQGFLLMPPASEHLVSEGIVRPADLRTAALVHLGRRKRPAHRPRWGRESDPSHLRVATYNVHYCKGLDGRFSPERIARVLRKIDADVIALQELDAGKERSRYEDQLGFIAEELGMHTCFCPSIIKGTDLYGHGLLSRSPIEKIKTARLPDGGRVRIEPRDALHARTDIAGHKIDLFSTHLGLAPNERAAQIDFLRQPEWLGGIRSDRPALFLGDLNLAPGGRLYRRLVHQWTSSTDERTSWRDVQAHAPQHTALKTFPSFLPFRRLDHIFASDLFRVHDVSAPQNALTRLASDHLPLVADLSFDNEPRES